MNCGLKKSLNNKETAAKMLNNKEINAANIIEVNRKTTKKFNNLE